MNRVNEPLATAALSGTVRAGDIVRIGNWTSKPGSLSVGANGNGLWLNGAAGWLGTVPATGYVRVYRETAGDAAGQLINRVGRFGYRYVRSFLVVAGGVNTVALNDSMESPAGERAADCYFDSGDKLFVAGDTSASGRTFSVSSRNTGNGRLDLTGMLPQAPTSDTTGWFARDAATFARAYDQVHIEFTPA